LVVNWIPGSENSTDMFTKKLDGPLFNRYAEQLLGEGVLDRHSKQGECLKVFLQYLEILNPFYVFGSFRVLS
jgi:hypothetical protein